MSPTCRPRIRWLATLAARRVPATFSTQDDARPQVVAGPGQRSPGFITRDAALGSAPRGDDDA